MTRIFNFVILFALAGIFYVQTDGFGAGTISASANRTEVAQTPTQPVDTPVVLAAAVTQTPKAPIKVANINAMTDAEKQAVQDRFVAQRLASSTVIRTVKMTKSTLQQAGASKTKLQRLVVSGNVVNARAEPTTQSDVLAKLRRGTEVVPTGVSEGVWAQVIVTDTGKAVWMHSKFLKAQS